MKEDIHKDTPMHDVVRMECPQCAIKHLSAALAYSEMTLSGCPDEESRQQKLCECELATKTASIRAAQAIINLVEYAQGYESHLDLAVGYLVQADESLYTGDLRDGSSVPEGFRVGRQELVEKAPHADTYDARRKLATSVCTELMKTLAYFEENLPYAFMRAHVMEACRECSFVMNAYGGGKLPFDEEIRGVIESLRKEYWDGDAATA